MAPPRRRSRTTRPSRGEARRQLSTEASGPTRARRRHRADARGPDPSRAAPPRPDPTARSTADARSFPRPVALGTLNPASPCRTPKGLSTTATAVLLQEKPMTRQRRAGGGVDRLPSGRYRVRIVNPDGRRLSLGTYATMRAAEAAYARALTDQGDGKAARPAAATTPTLADYSPAWVEARLTARGEPLRPRVRDLYAT